MKVVCYTLFLLFSIWASNGFAQHNLMVDSTNRNSKSASLDIPHFLKLDSSGQHEKWQIGSLESYPKHKLRIFNKAGNQIFQSEHYTNEWPNTHLLDTRYLFILDIEDKRISGWIEMEAAKSPEPSSNIKFYQLNQFLGR